jgi:hypothetical protein
MNSVNDVILKLGRSRPLAHEVLFKHRHSDETPPFHTELIQIWHSALQRVCTMAFREGGKSTIAEEALALAANYRLFHNCVIVGNTEKRACERLTAIKYELSTNELMAEMFGFHDEHTSKVWNEAEVILSNNVRLTALGRGQSLRGTKYLQYRPDFCFCDDVEEVEKGQVYTDEEALETIRWFFKVLIPALDKNARIRVNATPLSASSLPMVLARDRDWVTKIYPIEYKDEHAERTATWPGRYPLDWIDSKRASMERVGLLADYMQEYMCVAEDPKTKIFKQEMFKVQPRVRTWEPVFAMYDPARTTKATSATTGWAVFSWLSNRLVIWDAGAGLWKPDEIVGHIFTTAETYNPVTIGVEEDGLNEFLMQPLRHEQLRRNFIIPVQPMRAPKGKIAFIEGLQPFFLAGEISFAKRCEALEQQLLGFPAGRIDAPNALAYALRMRPGLVVFEDFGSDNVATDLLVRARSPVWACLNASPGIVTAVICQVIDGAVHVVGDYIREGDASAVVANLVTDARLEYPDCRLVAGLDHFGNYDRLGLRGAVARIPSELRRGAAEDLGRSEIRRLLRLQIKGFPAFRVSTKAHWTLNAMAAGYARAIDKRGVVTEDPTPGLYATLMGGLEAFTALMQVGTLSDSVPNYRVTEGGQRYVSALPNKTAPLPSKDELLRDFGAVTDRGNLSARR